jgi:transposase
LAGTLTEAQAAALPTLGPEAVMAFAMAVAAHMAARAAAAVSMPSGMTPIYEKPTVGKRRRKSPGAKPGHKGSRRKAPITIDQKAEHRLDACPCCGGGLQRCDRTRTRFIEDIPLDIKPIVTEHTIHRDYCPHCKKHVEPVVPDAMPGPPRRRAVQLLPLRPGREHPAGARPAGRPPADGRVGRRAGLGVAADGRGAGALVRADPPAAAGHRVPARRRDRLARRRPDPLALVLLRPDHLPLHDRPQPRRTRAQAVLRRGVRGDAGHRPLSVVEGWAAYDAVIADDRQVCIPHLLRELVKVDERNTSPEWVAFSKKLKRLLRDGIRLRKRPDSPWAQSKGTPEKYRSRIDLIDRRLAALATATYDDADAKRLAKRLGRFQDYYFTFLAKPHVPPDNNHA